MRVHASLHTERMNQQCQHAILQTQTNYMAVRVMKPEINFMVIRKLDLVVPFQRRQVVITFEVQFFGRFRKIGKSYYQLRQVCPSAWNKIEYYNLKKCSIFIHPISQNIISVLQPTTPVPFKIRYLKNISALVYYSILFSIIISFNSNTIFLYSCDRINFY